MIDRLYRWCRWLFRLIVREPRDLLISKLIKPPIYTFRGHDDELRKATQAKRMAAEVERKRAARIDAGGSAHESPRLRRVR